MFVCVSVCVYVHACMCVFQRVAYRILCVYMCCHRLLGRLATAVVFDFGEFRISRSIKARIIDPQIHLMEPSQPFIVSHSI